MSSGKVRIRHAAVMLRVWPGCLAACKTELTRLQLPGSGGGLELVVVLQCCCSAAVCSLGLSCYNYTLGGAASGYWWLVLEITRITSHLMVATNPDHCLATLATRGWPQCPQSPQGKN